MNIFYIMLFLAFALLCVLVLDKTSKSSSQNRKIFLQQLNWYVSYFGEENAKYLIEDLKKSKNPIKHLNELIRDINPELYNEDL